MNKRLLFAVYAIASYLLFASSPGWAEQNVVLKAHDGNFRIEGVLIGYDRTYYIIKSNLYGTMSVDVSKFTCFGADCPKAKNKIGAHAFSPQKIDFGIHGSNTIGAQLMPSLIEGMARKEKINLRKVASGKKNETQLTISSSKGKRLASIDLRAHGSSTSFTSLSDGIAQIGMSSRPAKPFEIDAFRDSPKTGLPQEHVVALDAVIVIVSPSNPISSLTMKQIAGIFSGEISNWSQLGGHKAPIKVYSRDRQSGTFDTFKSLVLKPSSSKLTEKAQLIESNSTLSDYVASDRNSIGFVGFAYERNSKAVSIANACGIKRKPSEFNVKTLEYPLTRKLFLYSTKQTKHPIAKKLLQFASTEDAQEIVTRSGFINRSIGQMKFDDLGDRLLRSFSKPEGDEDVTLLKEFVKTFKNSKRLTTTFRFKPNSVFLEPKSAAQILQLGTVLFRNLENNKKVYLVGFSDSVGDFEQNRQIALLRAQQVKNTILQSFSDFIPKDRIVIKSYSELLPVDCNTTPQGRHNNRRVEVWLPGN